MRNKGKIHAPSVVLGVLAGSIIAAGAAFGLAFGLANSGYLQKLAPNMIPGRQPEISQTDPSAAVKVMMLSENTIAEIASRSSKSVVNIDIKKTVPVAAPLMVIPGLGLGIEQPGLMLPKALQQVGSGSGIIIKEDGYILTNNHVVQNADEIKVTLSDKRTFKGKVIGRDSITDLALVKIPASGLPVAKLGTSAGIRPGDWAIAIGNPLGLDHTVTLGIISAIGRSLNEVGNAGELIQTDAAINPGNSGGPLLNIHGDVIGINTAIRQDGQNIGFAIPVDVFKQVSDELITKGRIARAYVGVYMQELSPQLNEALGVPEGTQGIAVAGVAPEGPASRAGLAKGDIIQKVDGSPVDSSRSVQTLVRKHKPGESISFVILREGKPMNVDVQVDDYPDTDQQS